MQSRDQAKVGSFIERLNFLMAVLPVKKNNGSPFVLLKAPVDATGLHFDLSFQIVIALQVRAARSADLHESKLPLISGIFFQQPFDRKKALEDPLGVVQA